MVKNVNIRKLIVFSVQLFVKFLFYSKSRFLDHKTTTFLHSIKKPLQSFIIPWIPSWKSIWDLFTTNGSWESKREIIYSRFFSFHFLWSCLGLNLLRCKPHNSMDCLNTWEKVVIRTKKETEKSILESVRKLKPNQNKNSASVHNEIQSFVYHYWKLFGI